MLQNYSATFEKRLSQNKIIVKLLPKFIQKSV